jgi:T-lymphoma invasion and metastasis-inducing protein 1
LAGIIKGDEIMVINGALVGDLDMMYIESVLQEELSLSLMIRSCRADPPDVTCLLRTTDDLIDSLVCPPPPSDQLITDDALSNLIVPAPSWRKHRLFLVWLALLSIIMIRIPHYWLGSAILRSFGLFD